MENKILIVFDGFNDSKEYRFLTSLSREEIEKAYFLGTEKVGFNLVRDCCTDDGKIEKEYYQKLLDLGFTPKNPAEESTSKKYKDKFMQVWGFECFWEMYFFIVKVGNPSFEYKAWEDDFKTIIVGGSGLFEH